MYFPHTSRNHLTGAITMICMFLLSAYSLSAQSLPLRIKYIVDTAFAAHPAATGIMVSIAANGKIWDYAVGVSDKATNTKLDSKQPVLVASNTKTYIAATILRLCELKKLNLTDTIGGHLSGKTLDLLRSDGYNTGEINITHLLSHTSGINDYVDDDYFELVNKRPNYKWTRDEQIERAVNIGKPLSSAGDTFRYADVNYLLLTEIIEHTTHQPFYKPVRELLKFNKLEFVATWFTNLEPKPRQTVALAHQYWNKFQWDSYELDPSWDLFGGGGIATTPGELAAFFKALFEGKIVADTSLLSRMYTDLPGKARSNYRLGIRKLTIVGLTGYYHGGFWGTDAIYFPEIKTAICIVILEKSERDVSAEICRAIAAVLKEERNIK